MAEELGVKLGCYYHNAASLHIYLNDFYGPRLGNLLKKNKSWFRNMKKKIFNTDIGVDKFFNLITTGLRQYTMLVYRS